jgi:hypothetical protein
MTADLEHVRGIRTLFRNLALLALLLVFDDPFPNGESGWKFLAWCMAIFAVTSGLSALTAFNYNCQVLDRVNLLCRASGSRLPSRKTGTWYTISHECDRPWCRPFRKEGNG